MWSQKLDRNYFWRGLWAEADFIDHAGYMAMNHQERQCWISTYCMGGEL